VNATKERQAWCCLQVKLCDPRLSALSVVATIKALLSSLNLVTNAFSLGLSGGMEQEKGNRERCSGRTVLHAQSTSALSSGFPLSQGNAEAIGR